jgi:N-glycosylase/DNA lyase
MVTGSLELKTPSRFNFWRTVHSHGWCALPPFSVDKKNGTLSRILELESSDLVDCVLKGERGKIVVTCSSPVALTGTQRARIANILSDCLRLNEDLAEFYKEANQYPHHRWIPKAGAGRLLRAPTVFEDVVKMICTTNCSWSLTEVMVGNLTSLLGKSMGNGVSSFPGPQSIAGTTDSYLRKNIRAGYRSPYLLKLATDVAEGKVNLESWRSSGLATEDLFAEVKTIKGMGDYAAGNILKLLGRYDYLGLDSWVRGKYYELHTRGRKVLDSTIEKRYQSFGKWRGLFFWLEMTREWYDHKFPF